MLRFEVLMALAVYTLLIIQYTLLLAHVYYGREAFPRTISRRFYFI